MKITCPECGFNRDVAKERLPGSSVIATCPKCGKKFKVSTPPQAEEEEDIRLVASRAYQEEADRFRKESEASESNDVASGTNPWQLAPEPDGWVAAFFQTVGRVMFAPSKFFSCLNPHTSLFRPLGFYAILLLGQSFLDRVWGKFFLSVLSPGATADPQLEKMLQLLATENDMLLGILLHCGIMLFQLYLFSAILNFTYRLIAPQKTSFELVFQLLAYSAAPAILSIVPVLGSLVAMVWSVGCFLIGCKTALNLNWTRTLLGVLPVFILMLPVLSVFLNLLQAS